VEEQQAVGCRKSSEKMATERTLRRIYVDADACPFKRDIMDIAAANGFAVTLVSNYSHEMNVGEGVEVVHVDRDPEAVDVLIANRATRDDIVVTQDYGLAAIVLGKGARALSPRGRVYEGSEIESLLEARHHAQRMRRSGGRLKGPPRLKSADREQFRRVLESLVSVEK